MVQDGSGVYRQDAILGPFPESECTSKVVVPHIEEIRAIKGADGEDYININDLSAAMNMVKYKPQFLSVSVFLFVKVFIYELINARR